MLVLAYFFFTLIITQKALNIKINLSKKIKLLNIRAAILVEKFIESKKQKMSNIIKDNRYIFLNKKKHKYVQRHTNARCQNHFLKSEDEN